MKELVQFRKNLIIILVEIQGLIFRIYSKNITIKLYKNSVIILILIPKFSRINIFQTKDQRLILAYRIVLLIFLKTSLIKK